MVSVRRQLVSDAVRRTHTFGGGNRRVGITVHETANRSKGANATAHANLQSRGGTAASWHWTVDDKEAVQSYDHDWRLFHAGTGSAGDGDDTVSIEICVNEGIDQALAYRNAIELIQHLWRIDGGLRHQLFQHHHWSGKNCPTILRAGTIMTWAQFVAASFGVPAEQPPVVVPPATEAPLGGTHRPSQRQERHGAHEARGQHAGPPGRRRAQARRRLQRRPRIPCGPGCVPGRDQHGRREGQRGLRLRAQHLARADPVLRGGDR